MKTLRLTRTQSLDSGIFSILEDENNVILAHTLEHNFNGIPKVYNGTFICKRGTHKLSHGSPFETFEITGVKGHSGILFHKGNFNKDSDGCVLLGDGLAQSKDGQMVTNSKATFDRFLLLLTGVDSFSLIVS